MSFYTRELKYLEVFQFESSSSSSSFFFLLAPFFLRCILQVCPSDGKVLHFGRIKDGQLEQVKGVTYKLQKFLGPNHPVECKNCTSKNSLVKLANINTENGNLREDVRIGDDLTGDKGRELYHVILYLAPGDYHHFHSPADWKVLKRRHFPGLFV